MKRVKGFSIVELLIVMFLLGFVLAAGSDLVLGMMNSYRQQGKIAETHTEGIVGLEIMRRDLDSAGYGLPQVLPTGTTYSEAAASYVTAASYNDSPNPPRAVAGGSGYLVIRSTSIANNSTCTKSAFLETNGLVTAVEGTLVDNTDRVVVLSPGTSYTQGKTLIASAVYSAATMSSTYASRDEVRLIYGVDSQVLRMPFNRADYYISNTETLPSRCALGTGVLVKAILRQNDGGFDTFPLLDCVADMEVLYTLSSSPTPTTTPPPDENYIRNNLRMISVYILAHEGQRDPKFGFQGTSGPQGNILSMGNASFDLNLSGIQNWQNYRWKVYSIIVSPPNLR